jgi:peptide/nickel transport system permease protein
MAERSLPLRETVQAAGADSGETQDGGTSVPPTRQWLLLVPVVAFVGFALLASVLTASPTSQELVARLHGPTIGSGVLDGAFGTDSLGRDVLARVAAGARLSLLVGVIAAGISAAIGVPLGILAGLRGGTADLVITGLIEILLSVPTIVIGIVLAATLGQGMTNLVVLLVVSGWIGFARIARLHVRSLRQADFVLAAVAMGASWGRIAHHHMLPNLAPVLVVVLCQQVAAVMLWEASLTYLGIGMPIDRISLGGLVREGQDQVFSAWWISFFPGLAFAVAVVGFNLLADWIQARMSPHRARGDRSSTAQRWTLLQETP